MCTDFEKPKISFAEGIDECIDILEYPKHLYWSGELR